MKNMTTSILILFSIITVTSIYSLWAMLHYGDYQWTLFITVPFLISLCFSYSLTNKKSKADARIATLTVLGVILGFCLLLYLSGMEGMICILISLPLLILPSLLGSLIGYFLKKSNLKNKLNSFAILVFILPISSFLDEQNLDKFSSSVQTRIEINASSQSVWKSIINKVEFNQDLPYFFEKGVTLPTSMSLEKSEKATILAVKTNNDDFIKIPVSNIIENKLLVFNPQDLTPRPMKELAIHGDFDAKHLEGYLKINEGKFILNPISQNKCELIASTSYDYEIGPSFYWNWVSDKIIDNVHLHVLNSIKNNIEND